MLGRIFKLIVVASLCLGGPAGVAGAEGRAYLSVPTPDVLLMLVRTTLVALNQANFTGNYSVLHDLGTPHLQATHSQAQLGIAFTNLREQKLDLSRVLLLSPDLTEPPSIASDGTLRLAGVFATSPVQITFVMAFRPIAGIWRIEGLSVRTLPPPGVAAAIAWGNEVPLPVRKPR
jgi:hypothetical protein